jgi:hypothetical protein
VCDKLRDQMTHENYIVVEIYLDKGLVSYPFIFKDIILSQNIFILQHLSFTHTITDT